jgi:UrcA family protein
MEIVMKTFNYSKSIALAAAATLCVTTFAFGARADESAGQVPTRTVRYSDLNLNTQVGAEVLYQRIRDAAERVCGDVGSRQLDQAMAARACVERAVTSSVHAVNNPQLTSVYNQHFGVAQAPVSVASL